MFMANSTYRLEVPFGMGSLQTCINLIWTYELKNHLGSKTPYWLYRILHVPYSAPCILHTNRSSIVATTTNLLRSRNKYNEMDCLSVYDQNNTTSYILLSMSYIGTN